MNKRICVIIDDDVDKKIRLYQAKLIQKNQSNYSYSRVLNDLVRKYFSWKMSKFSCPNCEKNGLEIPLSKVQNDISCAFCNLTWELTPKVSWFSFQIKKSLISSLKVIFHGGWKFPRSMPSKIWIKKETKLWILPYKQMSNGL